MAQSLELRHLRYFVAVAEELNFTRAAERVFLTQPALSQQIKALEEILGVTLLERTQRKVRLTDAGRVFLDGARRTLQEADRAIKEARKADGIPRITLGYVEYAFQSVVGPIVTALLKEHPEIRLERREIPHYQIGQALENRTIDVGFGVLPMEGEDIENQNMGRARWQLVVPAQHPLAKLEKIPLSALETEPLIMFSRSMNSLLYEQVIARLRKAGIEPSVVYETAQVEAGENMVELGVGLWVVTTYIIADGLPETLVARDLEGFEPMQMGMAWRKGEETGLLGKVLEMCSKAGGWKGCDSWPCEPSGAGV
ncbi:LysR substrate-binding domain-containing protein [Deinococcus roseus]|uniref:Transcriptional regulator n=1 Tax=Deinococcus roseus TaxID=392414 RepID=A0ABQ2D1G9_9DEIO|nr:LysR substrate-binding domain-containing protein [Deinococcus roseus]GGJ37409.1 transcriptional regulator [Deinococcus roseus]